MNWWAIFGLQLARLCKKSRVAITSFIGPQSKILTTPMAERTSRQNSMHVSFLAFCFSAVCFFIYISFMAVEVLFEPFCPVDTVLLITGLTVLYLC